MNTTLATVTVRKWRLTYRVSAWSLSVLTLATMPPATVAAHSEYSFTRIADDTGPLGEIGISPVAINDAGAVAFLANLDTGEPVLFVGSGGALTTVADTSGLFRRLGFSTPADITKSTHGFPSINGLGQVTFGATRTDGVSGIFADPEGAITIIDNTVGFAFDGDPFSSGSGSLTTVEATVVVANRLRQAIVVGKGGPLTSIADTSRTFSVLDADPRINGSGQVAFHGIRQDGSEGIFAGNGGPLTVVADTSGPFASFSDAPAISDNGQILFQATLKASSAGPQVPGLFVSASGSVHRVADANGHFISFGYAPAINAQGQVAFLGTTRSGKVGIFTGGDPEDGRVVAIGDDLDGSTVFDLSVLSFRTGLNNSGQIAFIAQLSDGRTGVYRADPRRHHGGGHHDRHDAGSREPR
jgi:hypothetical protein